MIIGLEGAIILIAIGIILWAVSRAVAAPIGTALYYIGIFLMVIGVIFLIIYLVEYAMLLAPISLNGYNPITQIINR